MKTLDIQYRQAQSVNIDLGMLDIAIKPAPGEPYRWADKEPEGARDHRDEEVN